MLNSLNLSQQLNKLEIWFVPNCYHLHVGVKENHISCCCYPCFSLGYIAIAGFTKRQCQTWILLSPWICSKKHKNKTKNKNCQILPSLIFIVFVTGQIDISPQLSSLIASISFPSPMWPLISPKVSLSSHQEKKPRILDSCISRQFFSQDLHGRYQKMSTISTKNHKRSIVSPKQSWGTGISWCQWRSDSLTQPTYSYAWQDSRGA